MPSQAAAVSPKTRAMSSSERTSQGVTSFEPTDAGELADVALDPLALEREGELRALVGEPPRDRPRDRALVGDPEYERALSVEPAHGGESKAVGENCGYSAVRAPPRRIDRLGVALLATATASAGFQPIERRHGEIEIPRVRAGTITVPDAHRSGRITVILTLADPPLAAYSRTLAGRSSTRRLNTSSLAAKAYVAKLQRAQRAAAATLKRAIPEATVRRNYTILLNGMAVELPATRARAGGEALVRAQALPELPLHARAQPQPGTDRRRRARRRPAAAPARG